MKPATKARRPYDFYTEGVTQGILHTWKECRQHAKLKLMRWTPNRMSTPLLHGILMHRVLEEAHLWQMKNSFRVPSAEAIGKWVSQAAAEYRKEAGAERWGAEQETDFHILLTQIRAVALPYFQFWDREKKTLPFIQVENTFRIPYEFGGMKPTFLRGRLDGIYKPKSGGIWLYDAKNKSQISEDQLGEVLLRDWQVNFYLLATWKIVKEYPRGFLYNVMRRPALKLKQAEPLDGYFNRIREHIAEDPPHYFKRYEVAVEKDDLGDFEMELREVLREFEQWWLKDMKTHLFGQPCVTKYGLCDMVQADYNNNWQPYHQRDEVFSELVDV